MWMELNFITQMVRCRNVYVKMEQILLSRDCDPCTCKHCPKKQQKKALVPSDFLKTRYEITFFPKWVQVYIHILYVFLLICAPCPLVL